LFQYKQESTTLQTVTTPVTTTSSDRFRFPDQNGRAASSLLPRLSESAGGQRAL